MSVYVTLEGEIHFKNTDDLQKTIASLERDGWIKGHFWIDETGENETMVYIDKNKLYFPRKMYRNILTRLKLFIIDALFYEFVWASTDGMFVGGLLTQGTQKNYDLNEWAQKYFDETAPLQHEFESEDTYIENLMIWQNDVVDAFIENIE